MTRLWGRRGAMVLLLLLQAFVPTVAAGQSLLAADGLGIRIEPLDARSKALGGAGLGLSGSYLLEHDPAVSAGLSIPSATVTFQSSKATPVGGEISGYTRFPTLAVSYPYRGSVLFIQAGSFLDQEFEAQSVRTLDLGGEPVDAEDTFRSTGSVGRVSLGWARTVSESASVGVTVGRYVGTTERIFMRALDAEDVGPDVASFVTGGRFQASGLVVGAGATWDPSPLVRVAGSVSWSNDLTLSPANDRLEEKGRYRIPLELRGGGTVTLLPGVALHFGTTFADWTDTGGDLRGGTTRGGTWSYGGGLEWSAANLFGRALPLRIGARHRDLPFQSTGEPAFERTLSGGLGWHLVDVDTQPLARMELGIESGSREAGPLSEDFWRATVSVRVASG